MVMMRVRVYCDNEHEYKYAEQDEAEINPDWIPDGCEEHNIRDFVIDGEVRGE